MTRTWGNYGSAGKAALLTAFAVVISAFYWVPKVSWRTGIATGMGFGAFTQRKRSDPLGRSTDAAYLLAGCGAIVAALRGVAPDQLIGFRRGPPAIPRATQFRANLV